MPLILAVSSGHEGIIEALLASTLVDVNKRDGWGSTPLLWAIALGYEAIALQLLN